ncbi:hypothetical protein HII36_25365 [Nonomuraea sp. NN258]|uniref:hypothetical protein n=1 Tax=Nonomuraea antri TaxID=2730852 RepID=UPI0015689534|nr:hypothetical protein [Nonomuraea antri]NRQ35129.1 hypothetical protein [Nonomuraea antri]
MNQDDHREYPYQRYGEPYGQRPPPGYRPELTRWHAPPPPPATGPDASAIISLVLNCIAVLSCCNLLGIPGAILAGRALATASARPARARSLVTWSWVLFGLGFAIMAALVVAVAVLGAFD